MKPFVLFVAWLIHFSHEQYQPDIDCIVGGPKYGTTYKGTESKTENGTECVIWKDNIPNYTNLTENHNFCRNNNPVNAYKPWCYTAVQGNYWEYCDIPYCECRLRADDLYYNGTISTTRNGHTCKQWSPTKYKMELNNFCRTPTGDSFNSFGPWCFIDLHGSSLKEICNVPICGGVACPNLSSPHLVTLDRKSTYRYGETAIITCEHGYRFSTQTLQQLPVTCQESGTWNSSIPTCEGVVCSDLPHIVNMVTPSTKSGYRFPDSITMKCETGYIINDTDILRCQPDGSWSTPTPSCIVVKQECLKGVSYVVFGTTVSAVIVIASMTVIALCCYLRKINKPTAIYEGLILNAASRTNDDPLYNELGQVSV